jgi:hypothetical protein
MLARLPGAGCVISSQPTVAMLLGSRDGLKEPGWDLPSYLVLRSMVSIGANCCEVRHIHT